MKYKFTGKYHAESLGDEILLLPIINGSYDLTHCVYLEGRAEEMIKTLEMNSDLNVVCEIMAEKYPGNDEAIRDDLSQLVTVLKEANILKEE